MSPVFSRLTNFCWLFFPTLLFFSVLFGFYFFNTELIKNFLEDLWWMNYVSFTITAIIAWQFGRSRLVYACLLLFCITAQEGMTLTPEMLEVRYSGILFSFIFLMYSKDKGFHALNLCSSLAVLLLVFVFSWLAISSIQLVSQTWLISIDSLLFKLSPDIRAFITPINCALLIVGLLLGLFRLFKKPDNTHNALYFALVLSAFMHTYQDDEVELFTVISLMCLFCYSILKDSFMMAFRDELTDIPSRRALMQYLQTIGRKYSVVMCDIDHFKKFNDTYGHDVGDEVLKLVASKLHNISGGGKTFRFGGEEFIIIFPRKTAAQVMFFVQEVRRSIADYDITLRASPRPPRSKRLSLKKAFAKKTTTEEVVKVTSSFGIAQQTKEHSNFDNIMKQADIALYAAKKNGRNCVKLANQ